MELPITITSMIKTVGGVDRRSDATVVMAKVALRPLSASGSPEFFFGRLLDASEQEILYFKFAPGVKAGFRGTTYRFEELEKSGVFKLVREDRP